MLTQDNRLITIETPLGKDVLLLEEFRGREEISGLFSFDLKMFSKDHDIPFKDIIGKNVSLSIQLGKLETRYFHGIISCFSQNGCTHEADSKERLSFYSATMVPWFWLLTRTSNSRIFQDLSTIDIVKQIFQEKNFKDFKIETQGSYDPKVYCVQYRETDFNFISRLLEEEGLYYFFEHEEKKHTMVIADSSEKHKLCHEEDSLVSYHTTSGGLQEADVITSFDKTQEIRAGKYTFTDYNFEVPNMNLKVNTSTNQDIGPGDREIYDYPGGYATMSHGEQLLNVRMQEEETQITTLKGTGNCRFFTTGYSFKLSDHYREELNDKKYVLTTIEHSATQSGYKSGTATAEYSNNFTSIPFEVPFKPLRKTPKPFVRGTQPAIVVGQSGDEIYTDEYGRVKVQFIWDREGKKDEKSSCWIRVSQPWAGAGWGGMFLPHVGHEVIVSFEEGDPDRPIITGRVYHGVNLVPDELPANKTKSSIRSWGDNDIVIEDKDGDKSILIKQANGNEIFLHETKPDITIKQECGNKMVMDGSTNSITINDPANNIIKLDGDGKSIQLKNPGGNEIFMDSDAGTVKIYATGHESKIVLGKSIIIETLSDMLTDIKKNHKVLTQGDLFKSTSGATSEMFLGIKEEYFAGVKTNQLLGAEIKHNAAFEKSYNATKRHRTAKDEIKYESKKQIILIGGKGQNAWLKLDGDSAYITSGGKGASHGLVEINGNGVRIDSAKKIIIDAATDVVIQAKNIKLDGDKISIPKAKVIDFQGNKINLG